MDWSLFLVPVAATAPGDEPEEEAHAGGDEHRLARVVADEQADLARDVAVTSS
jgi:hypothetical protein